MPFSLLLLNEGKNKKQKKFIKSDTVNEIQKLSLP